ncbi:MAG: hypothetical protein PHS04_04560 [Tissierellia bacterium]|jgi:hypothetical protein|nr:hypothetical protein [Tissierellia bacterium]
MKKFLFIIFTMSCIATINAQDIPKPTKPPFFDSDKVPKDCMIKGYSMNAKVKITNDASSPTFRVRVLEDGQGGEDLTVRFVKKSRSSSACGQWEIVESGEDFTVAFVKNNEDFIVRIAEPF